MDAAETYLSINEACALFSFSRTTFYRMYSDPKTGLQEIVLRVPPRTGRIRIPRTAFEAWLREKRRIRRPAAPGEGRK